MNQKTKKRSSHIFVEEHPLLLSTMLAQIIGVEQAIALQRLHFLLGLSTQRPNNVHQGKVWVYNTYQEWQKDHFPFWNATAIKRIFSSLEKSDLVISAKFESNRWKQRKWYTIDYQELRRWIEWQFPDRSVVALSALPMTYMEPSDGSELPPSIGDPGAVLYTEKTNKEQQTENTGTDHTQYVLSTNKKFVSGKPGVSEGKKLPGPEFSDEDVLEIFNAYPKRSSKFEALRAIRNALARIASGEDRPDYMDEGGIYDWPPEDPVRWLLQKVERYSDLMAFEDSMFVKGTPKWFDGGSYLDDDLQGRSYLDDEVE